MTPRIGGGVAADFHLHTRDSIGRPSAKLHAQAVVRIAREAAAAIDGNRLADRPEKVGQRHV